MKAVNLASNIIYGLAVVGILASGKVAYSKDIYQKEMKCLADNIYFESLNQSVVGQMAVANVTMNRVNSKHFPDTICNVVWESKQFSWTHDGKSDVPGNKKAYARVYDIAEIVYNGTVPDLTEGATFYHADYVNPSWNRAMTLVVKIDTHIFYTHKGR